MPSAFASSAAAASSPAVRRCATAGRASQRPSPRPLASYRQMRPQFASDCRLGPVAAGRLISLWGASDSESGSPYSIAAVTRLDLESTSGFPGTAAAGLQLPGPLCPGCVPRPEADLNRSGVRTVTRILRLAWMPSSRRLLTFRATSGERRTRPKKAAWAETGAAGEKLRLRCCDQRISSTQRSEGA